MAKPEKKTPKRPAKISARPAAATIPSRIFISWSGPRSRSAAEAFRKYLASNVPGSDPWISSVDIPSLGSSEWREEILSALDSCEICVSFLTADNKDSRWLLFEAGAVAQRIRERKRLGEQGGTKFALVLLDLETGAVREPLGAYQLTRFTKEALGQLVMEINAHVGDKAYSEHVRTSFDRDWSDLEREMMPKGEPEAPAKPKSEAESMLGEILQKLRAIEHFVADNANVSYRSYIPLADQLPASTYAYLNKIGTPEEARERNAILGVLADMAAKDPANPSNHDVAAAAAAYLAGRQRQEAREEEILATTSKEDRAAATIPASARKRVAELLARRGKSESK